MIEIAETKTRASYSCEMDTMIYIKINLMDAQQYDIIPPGCLIF